MRMGAPVSDASVVRLETLNFHVTNIASFFLEVEEGDF